MPRVKLFEAWNEENLKGSLDSPDLITEYRSLLNAAYATIKAVHSDNVVAVGGLAPVTITNQVMAPLQFAAQLMCLHRVRTHYVRAGSCPVQARFDAFSIHPYSLASTPTLHAYSYDDVLVADMGKVHTLLTSGAETPNGPAPHPLPAVGHQGMELVLEPTGRGHRRSRPGGGPLHGLRHV